MSGEYSDIDMQILELKMELQNQRHVVGAIIGSIIFINIAACIILYFGDRL